MGGWKYHKVTEPSPGVALVEFNRYALTASGDVLMIDHLLMRFMMSMSTSPLPAKCSMWLELRSIVESISESDSRVIVLSSTSEKFFTAGLDR